MGKRDQTSEFFSFPQDLNFTKFVDQLASKLFFSTCGHSSQSLTSELFFQYLWIAGMGSKQVGAISQNFGGNMTTSGWRMVILNIVL
jgi:hypothetical protein